MQYSFAQMRIIFLLEDENTSQYFHLTLTTAQLDDSYE